MRSDLCALKSAYPSQTRFLQSISRPMSKPRIRTYVDRRDLFGLKTGTGYYFQTTSCVKTRGSAFLTSGSVMERFIVMMEVMRNWMQLDVSRPTDGAWRRDMVRISVFHLLFRAICQVSVISARNNATIS